jgi:DNA-binding MarR family transcriptional regulator
MHAMELARLVLEAARAHRSLEARAARTAALTPADFRLLSAVHTLHGGATASQLARRLGLTRQSVQRVADRLSERGLASFTANPDHQRSPILRASETGRRACERVERELRDWEKGLEDLLEPEELETAELVLKALKRGLES